jgi:hypothetical protein
MQILIIYIGMEVIRFGHSLDQILQVFFLQGKVVSKPYLDQIITRPHHIPLINFISPFMQ